MTDLYSTDTYVQRLPIVLCLSILTSTAALPAKAFNAFQDAVNAAGDRMYACVDKNVTALDDGISSADVVAHAVVTACRTELDHLAETIVYGPRPHGSDNEMLENLQAKMALKVEKDVTSRATVAVLKHRKAKARSN